MISLRGRFVWFLCFVALSLGLMTAASEIVHAQSTLSFLLSGTVTDKDGVPVEGLSVGVDKSRFETRDNGTYSIILLSFSNADRFDVGDTLDITVTGRRGNSWWD